MTFRVSFETFLVFLQNKACHQRCKSIHKFFGITCLHTETERSKLSIKLAKVIPISRPMALVCTKKTVTGQVNSTSVITTSHEALHSRKTIYENCTVTDDSQQLVTAKSQTWHNLYDLRCCLLVYPTRLSKLGGLYVPLLFLIIHIFNDSFQTNYLNIYQTDICQMCRVGRIVASSKMTYIVSSGALNSTPINQFWRSIWN